MTFVAQETSQESGEVFQLFEFVFGAEVFRLTSNQDDVTWAGIFYTATQISSSKIQASVEDAINRVTISLPLDHPIPQKFIANVPGSKGSVVISRAHFNDGLEETIIEFDGFVASVKFDGELEAKVICNPQTNIFKRSGPRMTYSGLCNHVLYDARCKILRTGDPFDEFTFTGLVSGVSGNDITVNGLSANGVGWAVSGFVQAPAGAPDDKRLILAQSGDTITLLLPFSIPVSGLNVDVLAGCTHDLAICLSKFDNVINYGGFPFIPRKNPFNSTLRGGS